MKILFVLVLIATISVGKVFINEENGILILNEQSFAQAISTYPKLIIDYQASWCGHCQKFAPRFEKACGILRKQNEPIYCAKINADDSKALGEKLGATQLPTVFYYKNGEKLKYEGALNEHGLTSWILEGRSLASMPMDLDTLENLRKTEHVFYAYFGPLEGKEFSMYQMIAKHDEFRNFTHTNDPAAIAKYKVKTPNIVAFRQFDEPVVHLTGEYERVNAIQFIREKGIAECIRFHEIDKLNIFRGKSTAVFLIADEEKHKKIIDTFCRAAKEDTSSMIYAYAGVATDDHKFLRKYINVFDKGAPVLCLVHFEVAYGLMRFDYDEDVNNLSTDDIRYFVKRFKSGALDRHYYDNQEDKWYHLTQPSTLTFENYEDVVLDTDNDVLVYYYTLNEGERGSRIHKALNKLTEELKRPDNLIIARYDWHKAPPIDHPNAKPGSIVFYERLNKSLGKVYEGDGSYESIKHFLEENSDVYKELYLKKEDL